MIASQHTRQHKNKKSMSSEDAEGEGGRPTLGFTITEALAAEEIVKKSFFSRAKSCLQRRKSCLVCNGGCEVVARLSW